MNWRSSSYRWAVPLPKDWNRMSELVNDDLTPEDGRVEEDIEIEELPLEVQDEAPLHYVLTPAQRQQFLGKLAEFEVRLLALTPMQQMFVLNVLHSPDNQTEAARKAGYSPAAAAVMACKLLALPKVAHLVALGNQLREDRTLITSDRTLNELAIIAFSNIGDYEVAPGTNQVRTREGVPEHALRAVASAEFTTTVRETVSDGTTTTFKTRIKLWPKTEALRMLAMYQKLLAGDGGIVINQDNRGQTHNYQHNEWVVGGRRIRF